MVLSGILGAKDFDSAMGKLNATLEKLQANATNFGTIVKQAFLSPLTATGLTAVNTETEVDNAIAKINSQITKGLHFQLPLEEINKLLPVIKSAMMGQTDLGLGPKSLGVIYENFLKQQIGMTQADKNISALQSEMNAKASQQLTTEQTIANIVLKKKDFLKLKKKKT